MGIEFVRPYAWLLLPLCAFLVWFLNRIAGLKRRGIKQRVALIARYALVGLLVAALSGPSLLLPSQRAATWALADVSASARSHRAAVEMALKEGFAVAPKDLQTGVIAFGRNAMVDTPLALGHADLKLSATPAEDATDIGRALSMALALLPEEAAGRIALISDGEDNAEGIAPQLDALKARGIAVDVLPLSKPYNMDAQVTALTPPAQVYEGESFEVVVRMDTTADTQGTLVLYANRQPLATRDVTLRKGENTFIFQDTAKHAGVVTYEVQLIAQGDENPYNNRLGAYMDVRGTPQVLIVEGKAGSGAELQGMLASSAMQAETLLASQLPRTAEALRKYHAIALANVDADDIDDRAMAALDDYVRKLGRGLAVFGGDSSYALGGYRGSKLEEMLPVTIDVDNRLDMPSLSLALVIDKSGSMTEGRFGVSRLDMAKEAAMRSTEVLTSRDNVGVIAFDDTAKWAVPMQKVEDVAAIQEMIGTIRPGGGTAFYSALQQAYLALSESQSELKHVIFLTDGEAGDSGFETVVQQMATEGITVTTVAVGGGANVTLLRKLAEWGKGRSYATSEFDDIPKVFTKETYLATQAYVQNRTFYPAVVEENVLTRYAGFPPLDGYLATTKKPLASVSLVTDREEPLLGWWQYGAGRVLAWTSDVEGAWTNAFLRWEDAARFFAGTLSFVLPVEAGEGEMTMSRTGDTVTLRYEVKDDAADLRTNALVLAPDGTEQTIPLSGTAPGVYEGTLNAAMEGAYTVRVEQRQGEALVRTLETGVTVSYPQEHDLRAADGRQALEAIAMATGGRMLTSGAELFTERGAQTRARWDLTMILLWAAWALFLLDVAQRRLAWERLLPERKPALEKKSAQGQEKSMPTSNKPSKRPHAPEKPAVVPPTDTADKLLAARKKKLM